VSLSPGREGRLKIPPFDELRVVSPSTSFRINKVEPPEAGVKGKRTGFKIKRAKCKQTLAPRRARMPRRAPGRVGVWAKLQFKIQS